MMNLAGRSTDTFFGSTSSSGGGVSSGWTAATRANREVSHEVRPTFQHQHLAVPPRKWSDRPRRRAEFQDALSRSCQFDAISMDSQASKPHQNAPRGKVIPNPSHPPDASTANLSQNGLARFADEEAHPVDGPVGAQVFGVNRRYQGDGEWSSRDHDEAVSPSQALSSQFGGPPMGRLDGQPHPQGLDADQAWSTSPFSSDSKMVNESTNSIFLQLRGLNLVTTSLA